MRGSPLGSDRTFVGDRRTFFRSLSAMINLVLSGWLEPRGDVVRKEEKVGGKEGRKERSLCCLCPKFDSWLGVCLSASVTSTHDLQKFERNVQFYLTRDAFLG